MSKFANLYFLGLIYLDIDHQRDDQNLPSKPKQIYEKKTRKHLCCQKYILPRHWQCIRCALWYRVLLQGVQVLSNPILCCNLVGVGALTSHKYTSGRINIWKHTLEKNQTNASGLRDYEGMHLSKVLAFIKKLFVFHVQKVLNQLNNASSFTSLGTKKIYIGSWGATGYESVHLHHLGIRALTKLE